MEGVAPEFITALFSDVTHLSGCACEFSGHGHDSKNKNSRRVFRCIPIDHDQFGRIAINREKKAFDEDSKNIKQLPQTGSVLLFL